MSKATDDAGLLFDLAAVSPAGFSRADVEGKYGWSSTHFREVVHALRGLLAGDSINLVCAPAGHCQPWTYRLVGTWTDARPWAANRLGDLTTRLDTIHDVALSLVHATDGRTAEGRSSRLIERTTRHLIEDLSDLNSTVAEVEPQ